MVQAAFLVVLLLLAHGVSAACKVKPKLLTQWGSTGSGDSQFNNVQGVAVGPDGKIYVVDTGNSAVKVFSEGGVFEFSFPLEGTPVDARQIAISANGIVYVSDLDAEQIQKYNETGAFLGLFELENVQYDYDYSRDPVTTPVEVGKVNYLAVDPTSGAVAMSKSDDHTVVVATKKGKVTSVIGGLGSKKGQLNSPQGVAFNQFGDLFVVDAGNFRVQMFTSSGFLIGLFGEEGKGNGEFTNPSAIATDLFRELVFVYDSGNKNIQVFQVNDNKFPFGGKFLGEIEGKDGEFGGQSSLAAPGKLYVTESAKNRVQEYSTCGNTKAPSLSPTFAPTDSNDCGLLNKQECKEEKNRCYFKKQECHTLVDPKECKKLDKDECKDNAKVCKWNEEKKKCKEAK